MADNPDFHPVQVNRYTDRRAQIPRDIAMAAYEVYSHVYAPEEALITGGCLGGFSIGELVAFLYAKSFPKSEWSARVQEAFRGIKL